MGLGEYGTDDGDEPKSVGVGADGFGMDGAGDALGLYTAGTATAGE